MFSGLITDGYKIVAVVVFGNVIELQLKLIVIRGDLYRMETLIF